MATSLKASQRLSVPNAKSLKSSKFIPFRPVSQRNVKARAAAVEEDLDFSFSLSDAKKNNSYEASEVANALNFYQEGGSAPAYELDQITNVFGVEDASLFADIDDEEAYADEYIVAGIPEAAPKRKGRGGRQQAGAQADEDDLEQAKALDKVKAMEDRMVLEAAMEEDFGDAGSAAAAIEVKGQGVWDWLTDLENKEADEEAKEMPAASRSTGAGSLSDAQVASDITFAKPEMFQDTDVSNYLELFGTDDVNEAVLAAADESTDVPELASELTDDDMARIDALLAEEIPVFESKAAGSNSVPVLEDEPEMDKAVVDQYIATIRAAASATGASEEEYKNLFGGESYTIEAAEAAEDAAAAAETTQLLAAAEPALDSVNIDFEADAAAIEGTNDEPADEDDAGLERELRALAAIEEFGEDDFGNDELLETIESYVVSAEDYVAQDEERKAALAAAVARGELSADVLADELEDMPDAVDEMVAEVAMATEDDADMSLVEEDDGETWQERILELTRVTKVVKGGKIMGFRCVAVIGNQNGLVGVGCQAGREVAVAVKRTLVDAKRNVVRVPLVGAGTVPHRSEAKYHAARCVVLPASDGTGCIAGGSVRSVLELAGVKNCLAKRIGSRSALNSARATVKALTQMQTLNEVAKARGVPMDQLLLQ